MFQIIVDGLPSAREEWGKSINRSRSLHLDPQAVEIVREWCSERKLHLSPQVNQFLRAFAQKIIEEQEECENE